MAEWVAGIEAWMVRHNLTIDLVAVWVLAVGFLVYAIVKFASWRQIVHQRDRTDVGRTLKWQKSSEAVMGLAMSALYSLTLVGFYAGVQFGVWERVAIRAFVVIGIVGAVLWGVRFTVALRREDRRYRR